MKKLILTIIVALVLVWSFEAAFAKGGKSKGKGGGAGRGGGRETGEELESDCVRPAQGA